MSLAAAFKCSVRTVKEDQAINSSMDKKIIIIKKRNVLIKIIMLKKICVKLLPFE
jgi:hypothetical protein